MSDHDNNTPPDDAELSIIQHTVDRIVANGNAFEQLLLQREANNPEFQFLQPDHRHHYIYKNMLDAALNTRTRSRSPQRTHDRRSRSPVNYNSDSNVDKRDIRFGDSSAERTNSRSRPTDNKHTNVYLAGLPYSLTKEQLDKMMSEFGHIIESTVVHDKVTGRSRGIGFVRYETMESCYAAIERYNGVSSKDIPVIEHNQTTTYNAPNITVRFAVKPGDLKKDEFDAYRSKAPSTTRAPYPSQRPDYNQRPPLRQSYPPRAYDERVAPYDTRYNDRYDNRAPYDARPAPREPYRDARHPVAAPPAEPYDRRHSYGAAPPPPRTAYPDTRKYPPSDPNRPLGVCAYYNTAKGCVKDNCPFVHSAESHTTPVDNRSIDTRSSEHVYNGAHAKTQVCKYAHMPDGCRKGDACPFIHPGRDDISRAAPPAQYIGQRTAPYDNRAAPYDSRGGYDARDARVRDERPVYDDRRRY